MTVQEKETAMKRKKRYEYIVSGNTRGVEQEPALAHTPKEADVAILGAVAGALGQLGYVKEDGGLRNVEATIFINSAKQKSYFTTAYRVSDFGTTRELLNSDEHIASVTLRRLSSTHSFAEWIVTKVPA